MEIKTNQMSLRAVLTTRIGKPYSLHITPTAALLRVVHIYLKEEIIIVKWKFDL